MYSDQGLPPEAVTWLRRLVAVHSPRRPGFDHRSV